MNIKNQMAVALTMSTVFTIVNIIAVTSGSAEIFYSQIEQIIDSLMH
jgi:hypothetical protein